MHITKNLIISKGVITKDIPFITKNTQVMKITKDGVNYFALIQELLPPINEKEMLKEVYTLLECNEITSTDAKGFGHRDDFKIFLYGVENDFITNVIGKVPYNLIEGQEDNEGNVRFENPEKKIFKIDYQLYNKSEYFIIGDVNKSKFKPEVELINSVSEKYNIEIKDVDCKLSEGFVEYSEGFLTLTAKANELLEEFPAEVSTSKVIYITINCNIDGDIVPFETYVTLCVQNKKTISSNFESAKIDSECLFLAVSDVDERSVFATQDIDFLAEAIFEIDEKLLVIQEQLPGLSPVSFSEMLAARTNTKKGVSCMAELWARWIQTGRRAFSQCPAQYREEVRQLLADAGLDENGQPLRKN